jgi:hypothetical protein
MTVYRSEGGTENSRALNFAEGIHITVILPRFISPPA